MKNVNTEYEHNTSSSIIREYTSGEESDAIVRRTNQIYFLICHSCYWCASYFSIDNVESSSHILSCHVCNSHDTELIPISSNESFRINYNVTRGMEMEFYRTNEIVDRQKSAVTTGQYQVPIHF